MATETERKFLVKGEFKHLASRKIEIVQRYLTKDPEKTIRIRIADNNAYFTVKGRPESGRITRKEWEFEIPTEDALEMMKLCIPGKIVKTRYLIPAGNHTFEVDVFHDRNAGLVIAELELSAEEDDFTWPEWLGEEVTGNPYYYNANLAK
jgi:adenylate cyclase